MPQEKIMTLTGAMKLIQNYSNKHWRIIDAIAVLKPTVFTKAARVLTFIGEPLFLALTFIGFFLTPNVIRRVDAHL